MDEKKCLCTVCGKPMDSERFELGFPYHIKCGGPVCRPTVATVDVAQASEQNPWIREQ